MLMPGKSYGGELPPLTAEQIFCAERMKYDVLMLAGAIGERNTCNPETLAKAEAYIADRFSSIGYVPYKESFLADDVEVANVVAEVCGNPKRDEIVIIGAHYDSATGTPGANDNASAVAVLLELASVFKNENPERTLRFVAFTNEEPPYSWTDLMGSRVHAVAARVRGENVIGMLCLECLGIYCDDVGTQQYPAPLEHLYPDTANFVAFCSNISSYPLLRECIKEFRDSTPFPSEGISAPDSVQGISWSDHWSFWQEGYPAIMITDTAFFRYPHYHLEADTPDRLDYGRMTRVTDGIAQIIRKLTM